MFYAQKNKKKTFFGSLVLTILVTLFLVFFLREAYSQRFFQLTESAPYLSESRIPEKRTEVVILHQGNNCSLTQQHLPAGLKEADLGTLSQERIAELLTGNWKMNIVAPASIVLEYTGSLCPYCRDLKYVGLYDYKIAIFRGVPPTGVLEEITLYEVKDIYREELRKGIPFSSEEEKKFILESYTT